MGLLKGRHMVAVGEMSGFGTILTASFDSKFTSDTLQSINKKPYTFCQIYRVYQSLIAMIIVSFTIQYEYIQYKCI